MKILLAILMLAVPAFGQAPAGPVQGPPPKNLTKQPDGHVSANTDPANPEKFETHVVLTGETLSEISGAVLKDSKLWPQLWEMNEHIVNPHWIYPGDPLFFMTPESRKLLNGDKSADAKADALRRWHWRFSRLAPGRRLKTRHCWL
jgi:hypothetical protein